MQALLRLVEEALLPEVQILKHAAGCCSVLADTKKHKNKCRK